MIIKVWHRLNPTFMDSTFRAEPFIVDAFPQGYEHVADVEVSAMGMAFQVTNTIDSNWWENAEVTLMKPGGRRSTSVGDAFELPDGAVHVVEGCGFTEIRAPKYRPWV